LLCGGGAWWFSPDSLSGVCQICRPSLLGAAPKVFLFRLVTWGWLSGVAVETFLAGLWRVSPGFLSPSAVGLPYFLGVGLVAVEHGGVAAVSVLVWLSR